jgi:hypothetical protein
MWGRVVTPTAWVRVGWQSGGTPLLLTLHRDAYYVTASVMLLVVAAWAVERYLLARLEGSRTGLLLADATAMAVMTPLVFLFLRPINQFIYFQF